MSFQTLSLTPRFALGSLRALAALQADAYDDARDMQPGKIEHEVRYGELAASHLVPHTPYYGSHEATTLYVLVAAWAWRWHGDRAALDALRPHVDRALSWIDTDGDFDGDGLQEYQTRSPRATTTKAGKTPATRSSVQTANSRNCRSPCVSTKAWLSPPNAPGRTSSTPSTAIPPARTVFATTPTAWPKPSKPDSVGSRRHLLPRARRRQTPDPIRSPPTPATSSGPAPSSPQRARRVAARLLAPDMWTGWGIRTLSAEHVAYNPFSYQLGSVWPHDNAFLAAGFRNYGLDAEAAQIARALFDAAARFTSRRLPELFAGLQRDPGASRSNTSGQRPPSLGLRGHRAPHRGPGRTRRRRPGPSLRLRPALPAWLPEITSRTTHGR